jgi:two-component system cell cycle sensor histidine kinase/response regulator CckA
MIGTDSPGLGLELSQEADGAFRPRLSRRAVPQAAMSTKLPPPDQLPNGEALLDALRQFFRERPTPYRAEATDADLALFQLQKLVTLGQLASQVAHDFGNLTTVMLGYSDLLLTATDAGRPEREFLSELRRAAERASALATQLLGYSRPADGAPAPLDLAALLRGLSPLLAQLLGSRGHLAVTGPATAGPTLADARQIEQAVVSLVMNARDALPLGGGVEVSAEPVSLREPLEATFGRAPAGDYVRLRVRDGGCGMSAQTQAQLFRPFFSTKPTGAGLGLTIVARIAQQCGAAIVVQSEPGHGTTVDLYFPRLPEHSDE